MAGPPLIPDSRRSRQPLSGQHSPTLAWKVKSQGRDAETPQRSFHSAAMERGFTKRRERDSSFGGRRKQANTESGAAPATAPAAAPLCPSLQQRRRTQRQSEGDIAAQRPRQWQHPSTSLAAVASGSGADRVSWCCWGRNVSLLLSCFLVGARCGGSY